MHTHPQQAGTKILSSLNIYEKMVSGAHPCEGGDLTSFPKKPFIRMDFGLASIYYRYSLMLLLLPQSPHGANY
jgi:hypothetical protein